jgi:hypothetical protein
VGSTDASGTLAVILGCKRMKRRMLTIALASLIGGALLAPAAQGARSDPQHSRYRYFQDLSVTGQHPAQIAFGLLYKKNRSGEFTPRKIVGYNLHTTLSCNPGSQVQGGVGGNGFSKYAYFSQKLTKGRFATRFEYLFESPQFAPWKGDLHGKVLKRLKRGGRVIRTARVNGSFDVQDYDPYGLTGVQENCIASGSYSAKTCKRWMSRRAPNYRRWKRWKVPVCSLVPW